MRRLSTIKVIGVVMTLALLVDHAFAHPAWGIAVDRSNEVFFTDLETIWKIDARGTLTVFRQGVSGRHVHDINIDENGILYGADNSYEPSTERFISAFWRMTPAGEFSYTLPPTHIPPKGMTIWRDRAGNSYYIGKRSAGSEIFILRRSPAGNVTTLAGNRKGADGHRQSVPYSAGATAFGTNGSLYFTDGANVRKLSMDGRLTLVAGNIAVEDPAGSSTPDANVTSLLGIALDTNDNAFVADFNNRRVIKIDSRGTVSTAVRAEQPWSPTGVAWRENNLYILESGFRPPRTYATRVRKVAPDGKVTVLASVGENLTTAESENLPETVPETATVPTGSLTYFLVTVALGVFSVAGVLWWHRRKASNFES